jgi:hypothetical protein
MSSQDKGVVAEQAWLTLIKRLGKAMIFMDEVMSAAADDDIRLVEVRVRPAGSGEGEYLVVVKADTPYGRQVGFHSADVPSEALRGAMERIRNKTMKWREDTPYAG